MVGNSKNETMGCSIMEPVHSYEPDNVSIVILIMLFTAIIGLLAYILGNENERHSNSIVHAMLLDRNNQSGNNASYGSSSSNEQIADPELGVTSSDEDDDNAVGTDAHRNAYDYSSDASSCSSVSTTNTTTSGYSASSACSNVTAHAVNNFSVKPEVTAATSSRSSSTNSFVLIEAEIPKLPPPRPASKN